MRWLLLFCLMAFAGCTPPVDVAVVDGFSISHSVRVVKGHVASYLENGKPLTHHYAPIVLIRDTNTYTLTAYRAGFDVDDSSQVKQLIAAAITYCNDIGFVSTDRGIAIMPEDGALVIPDFCVPPNAYPRLGKAGDRVPR